MAATDIAFFTERLTLKEQELGELKSAFHTYKLKQKVKYDNLKKDVYAFCRTTGQSEDENDNVALMQIKVAELETELEEAKRNSESLVEELSKKQTQLNDHMILIKNLETRLKEMSPEAKSDKKSQNIDMERVQQQMLYKDQRIIELNNNILEKERQILDLQEMCREQGEVADVKKQAMKIVQKKFKEIESRGKKEVGTETDPWFPPRQRDMDRGHSRAGAASRSLSPGHAIVSRAAGGSSPPPLDPQFESENASVRFDDDDMLPGTSSGFHGKNLDEEVTLRKKERKRVTFDLPPTAGTPTMNLAENDAVLNQLNATIARLTEENSNLMADLDHTNVALAKAQTRLDESEQEISRLLRDTKNSSLKARAVAHSRIRELEETLAGLNEEHINQSNRFTTEIETLRSTREWEVEQNGRLRDHLDKLREKNTKLTAEVDATGVLNIDLERKVDEMRSLIEGVSGELDEAEELVVFLEDQKESMLDDVEKMKEALFAQDEYIKLLETDNVIYEEHIGILRDSLGASKVDHRSLLRSKAFETKLKALEQEKEQISIKSREEKLKTKALAQKVKVLEEENEKLMERLCEKEMGAADDADMSETCRQLEARLRESDQQMNFVRTQFELELEAEKVENRQRQTECEDLKYRVYSLENRPQEQYHAGAAGPSHQQTQLAQVDNSQEVQELRDQVQQSEARIRELVQTISVLETELDTVRGANFELQDRAKEADEIEKGYDDLIEKHRTTCVELVSAKEALEKLQAETADMTANEKLRERAEKEVTRLRVELDGSRNTYNENVAIKQELEVIKNELEQERAVVQQKWEDVCRKAFETPSEPGSRKSSMEIQNQQYMIAFEDKIEKLEEDLISMTSKLAESEIEKQDLRRQLKRIQEVDSLRLANEEEQAQKLMIENDQLEMAVEMEKKTEEELLAKISDLELEASLAGELSVEMGRVIQHLEKQMKDQELELSKAAETSHSAEMELRLHEMLNEELGSQLDDLKEREKVWTAQHEEEKKEADKNNARLEQLNQALAAQTKENQLLVQQIQELESRLTTSVTETKDARTELQESRDEVREVQDELKDAQMAEVQRQANSQEHFQEPAVYQTQEEYQRAYAQWYYSHAGHLQAQTVPQQEVQYAPQSQTSHQEVQYPQSSPQELQYPAQYSVQQQSVPQAQTSQKELQYPVQSPETSHSHDHQTCNSHQSPSPVTRVQQEQTSQQSTSQNYSNPTDPTVQNSQNQNRQRQEDPDSLEQIQNENELLRQCVNETIQLREDMSQDVEKLLELKNELEIAVNSLKGEIWTLNGQLKASILDRENLEDRVVSLDTSLMEEKKKVSALDVELSEHVELIEKATRQAAEAENESNRRLAECLEMETRRIELEEAYSQLTEYYNQLQAAYNALYASQQQGTESGEVQQRSQSIDPTVVSAIDLILEELSLSVGEADIRTKLNAIQEKIRQKIEEVEQLQTAVSEQSRVARALEDRLDAVEEDRNVSGGEQLELRNRVEKLEGDLEWKQEECDSLRRQVDELQHSLNTIIVNDGDDSARLATRQADVDSLFRTNAELAHTNIRLQNELDDREETGQENDGNVEQQALAARVQELEKKLSDWTDSKEEIEKLKSIEKVLNNRILSLEDQLLEKEEQLQQMEEQAMEAQAGHPDRIQVLEAANQAVIVELEELRQERDALQASIQTKEKEQSREKEQAQEEVRAYQDELEEMKTELEALKIQVTETEEKAKIETVQPTKSEWGDWGESREEDDRLKEELMSLRKELAKAQEDQKEKESLFEEELEILKKELEESQSKLQDQKEENWGEWEDKPDQTQEVQRLEKALEDAQNDQEELKLRNVELEEELASLLKQKENQWEKKNTEVPSQETQKEDNWGAWDEKLDQSAEVARLEEALETAQHGQEELKLRNLELEEELSDILSKQKAAQKLEKALEAAQNEKEDLKLRILELEEELSSILNQREAQKEESQVQRSSLERELDDVRRELENLRTRSAEPEEKENVEELKLSLEETQQDNEDLKLRNVELEEEIKSLVSLKESLEEQLSAQKEENWGDWEEKKDGSELEELAAKNADFEEHVKKLTEEEWNVKEAARIEEEKLRLEVVSLQKQLATVKDQEEDLKLRNMELKEEVKALSEKKQENWGEWDQEEKSDEIGELKNRVAELEGRLEDYDLLVEEAQKVKGKLEEAEKNLANKTKELESLQKPKTEENWSDGWGEDSSEGVDQLRRELEATNSERTRMEAIISRVEKENEELMEQLEEAGMVEREMNREVESTRTALTELQLEVQLLREEKSRLEVEITQNVKSEDAWGDDWEQNEDLSQKQKAELEECQNKLATVSSTLQSVEQTLLVTKESAQQRQVELEERIQSLEEEVERAQSGSEQLEEKEKRLTAIESRLVEMEKQNNLLKESEGRLLESVDEWGAIADKNQEEVDRLQKVVNTLESEKHSLLEEVQLLKTEIEKLKATQPKYDSTDLLNQLQALKTERDSLKEQLSAMSSKLTEVEKEKNQVKTAYDQLKAKIQARRAAQAAGSSNTPSRAPSRASVASIGEIREDPTELAYQVPAQAVQVQTPQTSYSQAVDARVQEFLNDVKEFLSRLDSISEHSLCPLDEFEQSIELMGKRKERTVYRSNAAIQQSSSANSTNLLENKVEDLIEEKSILEEKLRISEEKLGKTSQTSNSLKLSDEEVLRLHDEVERLKIVEKTAQEENRALSSKIEAVVENRDELQYQLDQSLTVTNKEVLRLQDELDRLRTTEKTIQEETQTLSVNFQATIQNRDELQDQLDQSQKLVESLTTELDVLKVDLELKDTKLAGQQEELRTLAVVLEQTRAELDFQTTQREEETVQKQSEERLTKDLEQENTALKSENSQLGEDLTALGAEVDQLETKVLQMEQENRSLLLKNTQLNEATALESSQREQLEAIKSQLNAVLSEKEDLLVWKDSELETLQKLLDNDRQDKYSIQEELEIVRSQLQTVLAREQNLSNVLERLQSIEERATLHSERITELEVSHLEQSDQRVQSLEKLQEESESPCQHLDALNQLFTVQEELEEAKRRGNELEQLLIERLEVIEHRATHHADKIDQLAVTSPSDTVLEDLIQENERLSSLVASYDSERNSMRQALSGLHLELQQAVSHVQKVEESLEEMEALKERNEELTMEIDSLRGELQDREQYRNQSGELVKSLEEAKSLLEQKSEEIRQLDSQNQDLLEETVALKRQLSELSGNLETVTFSKDELERQLQEKALRLEVLENERTVLLKQIECLEETVRISGEDRASLESEYRDRVQGLEEERTVLLERIESLEETVRASREDKERLAGLELRLEQSEDAVNWKDTELKNLIEENKKLEQELLETEEELKATVSSQREKDREIHKLTDDLNALEAELDMLTTKMLMMEQERRQVESERVQQSSHKEESVEEVEVLRKQIEEKKEEVTRFKNLMDKEREEAAVQMKDVLSNQHSAMEKEREQTEDLLKDVKNQLAAVGQEKENLIEQVVQLEGQLRTEQERSVSQLDHLKNQLDTVKHEKDLLTQNLVERTDEVTKSHQILVEELREELQRVTDDREKLREELEQYKIELELCKTTGSLKIQQLEVRLSELEVAKEEAQKLLTESTEGLQTEVVEWRTKFEQAYSDLCQLHPALQHAQTSVSQLLAQNAELHQQVVALSQEKESLSTRSQELVEESPVVLQVQTTEEVTPQLLVQTVSETRISIEDTVTESETESSSDIRPLLPNFDDVIDRVSSSSFVRAGAPITQPLIRRLRSLWGRRAVRPYLRYCVAAYFVFLHFMLFNCWFHF